MLVQRQMKGRSNGQVDATPLNLIPTIDNSINLELAFHLAIVHQSKMSTSRPKLADAIHGTQPQVSHFICGSRRSTDAFSS